MSSKTNKYPIILPLVAPCTHHHLVRASHASQVEVSKARNRRHLNSFSEVKECFPFNSAVQAKMSKHTNRLACAANEPDVRFSRKTAGEER